MKLSVGDGINEYLKRLENLRNASEETCGKAIYAGAGIVADKIKRNVENLPTDEGYGSAENKLNGIKMIQREGLKNSLGIAKMRNDNGYLNVKAGFDGYNRVKTKKYPKGQPNQMIARSVESGTSFMRKHPFVSLAVNETKEKAEQKMAEIVDREADRIMN